MDDLTRELASALKKIVDELRSDDDLYMINTDTLQTINKALAQYKKALQHEHEKDK